MAHAGTDAAVRSQSQEDRRFEIELAHRRELDQWKRDVNLIAYAASCGYVFNKAKSSVNFPALRHPQTGHKMLIGKGEDGHWLYYSVNTPESGSIIDFIQNREGGRHVYPIAEVRKALRSWTNAPPELPDFARAPIRHIPKDRAAVAATVEHATAVDSHPYLSRRGVSRDTLQHPRFRTTWRESGPRRHEHDLPSRTVLFLHRDEEGLCGFETKGWHFTGFARGGTKALWWSLAKPNDNRLVITESALDALSYHEVNPHPRTRYVSFAGALNEQQPALIERAISWMPANSTVVAATDRDKDGERFAARISELCSNHSQVRFERHAPTRGKDWNDELQELRSRPILPPSKTRGLDR
jgi:Toprim domain-containing protein